MEEKKRDRMSDERFIEFATQNTDDGEINNGFQDIKTGEWYYTKDSENAKKICGLLNGLQQRNKRFEEKIQRERTSFRKTHERWSKEAENKIKELSEENEQCKMMIATLRNIILENGINIE